MTALRRPDLTVAVGAALLTTAFAALALLDASNGTLRAEHVEGSIAWYLVAMVGFVAAVVGNERRPIDLRVIWVGAIVFRLLLLTTEPTLSDDVYRYIWEGHLLGEGVSPYAAAINDPSLDAVSIPARDLANNPDLASPYLPVAHGVFATVVALLPDSATSMQAVMAAFDLGVVALIVGLLRRVGLPDRRVLLYAWNPLVVVELAHGAHIDALMVFLAIAAVAAALSWRGSAPLDRPDRNGPGRRSPWWRWAASPALLAAATLTRPLPLLLAPLLWLVWSVRQRVLFVIAVVAPIVPFALWSGWGLSSSANGTGVFGSARVYSETFSFNSITHSWITALLDVGWLDAVVDDPARTARNVAVLGAVIVVGTAVFTLRRAGEPSGLRAIRVLAVPVVAYIVLAPIMHPWYVTLLAALLPFWSPTRSEPARRWVALAPWIYLMGALSLSYLTYRDPAAFSELAWVKRVEWIPTFALAIGAWWWLGRSSVKECTT